MRLYRGMVRAVEYLLMVLTGALAVVVPTGVFFRYVLGAALAWGDELGAFLLAWITYLGGVVALDRGGHMAFDNLVRKLPGLWRQVAEAASDLVMAAFFLLLLWSGLHIAVQLAGQQAISMPLPMGAVYGVMPLASGLMVWVLAHKYVTAWRKASAGAEQAPEVAAGLAGGHGHAAHGQVGAAALKVQAAVEAAEEAVGQ